MKTFVALLLSMIAAPAFADLVTLSWTNPIAREDGTSLSVDDIKETRVWCNATGWPPTTIVAAPTNFVSIELPVGVHTCFAKTVDVDGLVSVRSNEVTITVVAPPVEEPVEPSPPNAPTLIQP